jgi:hypothetical protein
MAAAAAVKMATALRLIHLASATEEWIEVAAAQRGGGGGDETKMGDEAMGDSATATGDCCDEDDT